MKKHAWKITRNYDGVTHVSMYAETWSVPGSRHYYTVGTETKAPNPVWGLFVFKTRRQARNYMKDSTRFTIWKCEVDGEMNNPNGNIFWPDGTMWVKSVKLLHKA